MSRFQSSVLLEPNSPQEPIEPISATIPLPLPKYPIGTRIFSANLSDRDAQYYMKLILRQILLRKRKTLNRLQKQGQLKEMQGRKMLPFHKEGILELLNMVRDADSIEVAGHAPKGMLVTELKASQCYLRQGQCHSGVEFHVYLLFRREVNGNKLVYLHPEPIMHEYYIKKLLTEEAIELTATRHPSSTSMTRDLAQQ